MITDKLTVGQLQTNCYLVGDKDEMLVIDPGSEGKKILSHIKGCGYNVKYIVLTHCHYDHIGAVTFLKEKLKVPVVILKEEQANYLDGTVNLTVFFGEEELEPADITVSDGDVVKSGEYEFKIIHTPGHTSGSMCLLCGNALFGGDTLFRNSMGRCDFPTGDIKMIVNSITKKLFLLDEKTVVYPGHGETTTIGYEKNYNEVYFYG